jgi:hypothetical protein
MQPLTPRPGRQRHETCHILGARHFLGGPFGFAQGRLRPPLHGLTDYQPSRLRNSWMCAT